MMIRLLFILILLLFLTRGCLGLGSGPEPSLGSGCLPRTDRVYRQRVPQLDRIRGPDPAGPAGPAGRPAPPPRPPSASFVAKRASETRTDPTRGSAARARPGPGPGRTWSSGSLVRSLTGCRRLEPVQAVDGARSSAMAPPDGADEDPDPPGGGLPGVCPVLPAPPPPPQSPPPPPSFITLSSICCSSPL